jgi:hypothetical protein
MRIHITALSCHGMCLQEMGFTVDEIMHHPHASFVRCVTLFRTSESSLWCGNSSCFTVFPFCAIIHVSTIAIAVEHLSTG